MKYESKLWKHRIIYLKNKLFMLTMSDVEAFKLPRYCFADSKLLFFFTQKKNWLG